MEKYKLPKGMKIKKKKIKEPKLNAEESAAGLGVLDMSDSDAIPAQTGGQPLVEKKKVGKIIRIKSKGQSDPNIIDARAITEEERKKAMERARLKGELKIRKKIKGLK